MMGVISVDHKEQSVAMATGKPRERQFQVVPVPGRFTRGRWMCWDYRDPPASTQESNILEFIEGQEKVNTEITPESNLAGEITVNGTQSATGVMLTQSVSEPTISSSTCSIAVSVPVDVPCGRKESSTIVVTSIFPAPVTPVNGTPSSFDALNNLDTALNTDDHADSLATSSLCGMGDDDVAGIHSVLSPPQTRSNATTNSSTTSTALSGSKTTSPQGTVASLPNIINASVPLSAGLPLFSDVSSPVVLAHTTVECPTDESSLLSGSNVAGGPSVVAIDNKIEQAMDLVKTHLTFAVREEVEILRSAIVELESKVAQLESQNQVLKQFAPAEVVANLTFLVQNVQKQLQQQQQPPITTLPTQQVSSSTVQPAAPILPALVASKPVIVGNQQPVYHVSAQQQTMLQGTSGGDALVSTTLSEMVSSIPLVSGLETQSSYSSSSPSLSSTAIMSTSATTM